MFAAHTSPGEYVLQQLLVPGQLCPEALREALAAFGAQLTQEQMAAATWEELRVRDGAGEGPC